VLADEAKVDHDPIVRSRPSPTMGAGTRRRCGLVNQTK
jgi:hypothetical protein